MKNLLYFGMLLAMLLSACAQAAAQTSATQPVRASEAARQVEVIWYVRSNEIEQKWENDTIIPGFEVKFPNIKINLTVVKETDFDTRMQAMIAAGNPPDIWSHWGPSGFQDYLKRGLVADLTPLIQKDNFDLTDFEPTALDDYKVDGQVMGLPMLTTGSFIFFNKDQFDKAGLAYPTVNWDDTSWTYARFLDMCKALTRTTGNPITDVYGCNLDFWPNDAYAWLFGKDLYPDTAYLTGFATESYLNDPLVIQGFQARQDIVWKYHYQPDPAVADALTGGGDIFQTGKVVMQLTGGWGWWNYAVIKDFKWGVAALPYGSPTRKDVVFTDPWMLSSKSNHPAEAWTFLKYLTDAPQQETWMKLTGAPPARKSLADKWYAQFPNMTPADVKTVHLGALKYGRESPSHLLVKFDQLDNVVTSAIDPITINMSKAADVLPAAKKQLDAALNQIKAEYK